MSNWSAWLRKRKTAASITALSVLVAVPVTAALIHQGFPVTEVDLESRDVWVTNGESLLAGRLNDQISELDGAVSTASNNADVLQDGDDVFLQDKALSSLERIDPAFTSLIQRVSLPTGATVHYGGDRLSVVAGETGKLWSVDAAGELRFDPTETKPIVSIGKAGQAVVTSTGTILAVAPAKGILYRILPDGTKTESKLPKLDDYQLSAAGEQAVILDLKSGDLVQQDGSVVELPGKPLKIQEPSASDDAAVIATGDSLVRVPLGGGDPEVLDADVTTAATSAAEVTAPVNLDGCMHGAWASSSRYAAECADKKPVIEDINPETIGQQLVFRVNRSVIALNNIQTGNSWLVQANMRLVDNWDEVTPPQEEDGEDGDEKASEQSFEDTLAERTEENRPPIARDDAFGVRPGRATVLPLLDNDSDADGDVLTIQNTSDVAAETGKLEYIDGGRALQFTPAEGFVAGTTSFRYSVNDGRPGGVAEANVSIAIKPPEVNEPPTSHREAAVSVEAGQTVTYNVLADWRDPDGDDIFLQSASPASSDLVRFTPDGFVTFTHASPEMGPRDVKFVVSDGVNSAEGTLKVDVQPAGALSPIGTPDFVSTFVGESALVQPLANDQSPSGAPLGLIGVEALQGGLVSSPSLEKQSVTVSSNEPGTYYLKYTLGAGIASSIGLIRVDVLEKPTDVRPPVAVKDEGYLRPNETITIPVLANDESPGGQVLAVQSVSVPDESTSLSVEVLDSAVIRVSSSAPIEQQLQFTYVVSDGTSSATAAVTVVPVPPLPKHQAPVATDDAVVVRAGDIANVAVLENDYHPDAAVMLVDRELVDAPTAGLAFVDDDEVRFQAPSEPGTYTTTYRVFDTFGEADTATVTFNVVGEDKKNNQPPVPQLLTSRVFAGATVRVDVPLDGLDPNGDSVVVDDIASAPLLGRVIEQGSTWFVYEAAPDSSGTDTFQYRVKDTYGAVAVGTIKIGVIGRPEVDGQPNAVDDYIEVLPGKVASVPVLSNDSDPNGYKLKLEPKLLSVDDGLTAEVSKSRVVIEVPEEEAFFTVRYQITNGKGGIDSAYIQVKVTKDAKPQFPEADDHVLEDADIVGKKTIDIDVLDGAQNPGGLIDDLQPSLEGANAASGEVRDGGTIRVTLTDRRQAIAYRLTDPVTQLSGAAFIIVPAATDGEPPRMKSPLPEQIVKVNETRTWKLSDITEAPSGKPVTIASEGSVVNFRGNGTSSYVDDATITFTPAKDYRGPASVSFEATDGRESKLLTLPITVGDPNLEDVPPTFTPVTIPVEAGEPAIVVDLRASSDHPNPKILAALSYQGLTGTTAGVQGSLSGSQLTVSAPQGTQPGTSATLNFTVSYKEYSIPGTVTVQVVSSSRPLPRAIDDRVEEGRKNKAESISVLANDYNPFPDTPLKIVDATVESAPAGGATATFSGSTVTVTPGSSKSGTVSVIYTIQDATNDPNRKVQGRITVIVKDVPDPPTIAVKSAKSGKIVVVVGGSPASNGSPIQSHSVKWSGGGDRQCTPGNDCSFDVTNGQNYTFSAYATNAVGNSANSETVSATAYGVPSAPQNLSMSAGGDAPTSLSMRWSQPADTGGDVSSYSWRLVKGSSQVYSGTTGGTSASQDGVSAGTYQLYVSATGKGGTGPEAGPVEVTVKDPPPKNPSGSISRGDGPVTCPSDNRPGCYRVVINWNDFEPGAYNIHLYENGSVVSRLDGQNIGASGSAQFTRLYGKTNFSLYVKFTRLSDGKTWDVAQTNGTDW
ncbi:Ig-like domain-containing protein [Plantibacter sp. ME-Dv--P-122b]|uniref:Ig-like domain-containing protein n=1 Tax=Plantibacter sp. ME-Dv--P-122b TaxID=3040300 RepID=UPI002550E6A9|nr:Ig-like domain-containing protein [Plantibacter sp. ME-Dv--P-122b]